MKTALLSVSDKTGITDFASKLLNLGYRILSTGGTARLLRSNGIEVTDVSDFTGFPEMMNGRVKTLHPKVHGAILGRRGIDDAEAAKNSIEWIDVVAVNLYPFVESLALELSTSEMIERIDIGGPSMIRSAAKNHASVLVVCNPSDYDKGIQLLSSEDNNTLLELRKAFALRAFEHTAHYDAVISSWLRRLLEPDTPSKEFAIPLQLVQSLRYGENPHQQAAYYAETGVSGRALHDFQLHQGKALSFNNIADLDGAVRAVSALSKPGCVIVKHMNPCGAAVHDDGPAKAFELALSGDPVSSFGGIVAFNRPLEADDVRKIRRSRTFFELVIAPGYSDDALELFAPKQNLRVISLPAAWNQQSRVEHDYRRVAGGFLRQGWDNGPKLTNTVVSKAQPEAEDQAAIEFAWALVAAVKSNGIVIAKSVDGGVVSNGIGAGQMSRVDAVRLALIKATRPVDGSVLASDAFFPFPDGPGLALDEGVTCIIQPGGSRNDQAVIDKVNLSNASMVFTSARQFRH